MICTETDGHDSFGPWVMQVLSSKPVTFTCPLCGMSTKSRLHYWRVQLPVGINVETTILKRPQAWIGVGCGCWSKFIRQVTHIAEAGLRKGYPA